MGLLLLNGHGTIVAANAAALDDLGYSADALEGQHIGLVVPGRVPAEHLDPVNRTEQGWSECLTGAAVEAVRCDGFTFLVDLEVTPFAREEEALYLCAFQAAGERPGHRSASGELLRHDRSTGCLNRAGLEEYLDRLIESHPESSIAVAYLELNGLLEGGESYPSGVVGELVAQAVTRLRGALCDQDELARVGRYEFVAVAVRDSEQLDIRDPAQRLSACLQAPLEAAAWTVPVKASIGISLYPEHARTPHSLIDRAEAAIRRAGKSTTPSAHPDAADDQSAGEARAEQLERIRVAVESRELRLYYQPQFDLRTLQTTGLEALLRWDHPDKGVISPGEFLSLMAEGGLMPTVSHWVLREAVALHRRLAADGILDVPIAVNVGPKAFEHRGFVDLVSQILDEGGMAAGKLEVEVTEVTAITDPPQVAANAAALRSLGVNIAIDDFGTGFSSLKQLRLANFSTLKIDRTYVEPLPGQARDQTVIAALLDLAEGLGMRAVAEGIETVEQLQTLRVLGCRYGQGYWYGRPMPEELLRAWLGRQR